MVIKMRMYYIFNIKESVFDLYRNNPSNLFKILENIYYMHEEEVDYGFSLFKQITNKIKITSLNNEIYIKLHKDLIYSKIGNEHIINDLYHDEVSVLKIKSSRLILESNKNYSSFFKILNDINQYFFVCDFKEKDFFFINDIKLIIMG